MEFLPRELIEKINHFKLVRKTYNKEYPIYEKNIISQKNKIEEKLNTINIKSNTFFTIDELKKLSLNIGQDFKPIKYDFNGGLPYKLCQLSQPTLDMFENMDFNIYKTDNYRDSSNDDKMSSEYADLKIPDRLNKIFMDCVNIINSMEIQIYAIDKKLQNYHNGSVSMLCGDCDVFIFHCRKNDLELTFDYCDDCDWPNGCLSVGHIINAKTQIPIKHSVSFEISNYSKTNDYNTQKFFAILNGEHMDTFKNRIYGHIIQLPQLLANMSKFEITITEPPKDFFDDMICISYSPKYYIRVISRAISSKNKSCIITPGGQHRLYISTSPLKTIWQDDCFTFKYKSTKDIDELIERIQEYMSRSDYSYGYKENNTYYNEQYFKTKIQLPNTKLQIAKDINNLTGFDLYFILYGSQCNNRVLCKDRMPTSYIIDCYGIRFRYNKTIDPLNCIVTISSVCVDAIALANEFDKDNSKKDYDNKLHIYFPLVTIHDSYLNCITIIEDFKLLLSK